MAISIHSNIKDIIANEKASSVLEKYIPGFTTDSQMKASGGMSLKSLCNVPQTGISKEDVAKLAAELDALNI